MSDEDGDRDRRDDERRAAGEDETPDAAPTAWSYGLVVAGALSYGCLLFVWFSLPAYLSTVVDQVGLSGTEAGVLTGAVPLTYVPLALFSGLAVDRIGPVRSIAAGLVVFGTAQAVRSAAPGFPSLLAATVLLGVGATAITFGLPKLVSRLFPPDRTGFPSSIYLVGASAGTATAFAVGRSVLGPALGGWRPLFLYSGLASVGYAGVWLAVARLAPVDVGGSAGAATGFSRESLARDLRAVLGHRELRLVVVVGTMNLLVIHGMQGWLPTVLESRGLSPALAGRATSLLVVANVVGVLAVPAVADRYGRRRAAIVGCGGAAATGVLAVLAGATGPLALAGVLATGFGVGGVSPLVRAIPPDLEGVGPRLTGTAVGFVFAVGEVGGFLGPVAVGTLRDLTGSFSPGLAVLAGGGLAVALVGTAMREV
ncbi:CynX/NimT family MFS transporter [Halomicrobium salinisoli]|uniref:MFS transporter n=1 Tax=Halomicrobium salinisoli TaxID=2878391 RepID=UPI001CEFEE3F|nr:MFS transporter [Halomicrobium salinisoli]